MPGLFGTDGVRGVANRDLTPELCLGLGLALGSVIGGKGDGRVLVARDTRVSGSMLEAALAAGLAATGLEVGLLGVMPTPALALLVREEGCLAGAVVSASHNPPAENGVKFVGPEGFKLEDALEEEVERVLSRGDYRRAAATEMGRIRRVRGAGKRYLELVLTRVRAELKGMKVVADAANGAAFRLGPEALARAGAEVRAVAVSGRGEKINVGTGAAQPGFLSTKVVQLGADAGVAWDGDADRCILVDEEGWVHDGDAILALAAETLSRRGELGAGVAITVMSNAGLRRFLRERGIPFYETPVGDRYVAEAIRQKGLGLGGEQSGHVVFPRLSPTGDGILTALWVLGELASSGRPVSYLRSLFRRSPQVLLNVEHGGRRGVLEGVAVREKIEEWTERLGEEGRVLVRESGTEPLVRVMVEAPTEELALRAAEEIAQVVRESLGRS